MRLLLPPVSRAGLACALMLALPSNDAQSAPRGFEVRLEPSASAQPVSGRLLVFAIDAKQARADAAEQANAKAAAQSAAAKPDAPKGTRTKAPPLPPITEVDTSPFKPTQVSVAAIELAHLAPGKAVSIDTDAIAFPSAFSALPDGEYIVQAVLDVNHDYNYGGRGAGDIVSDAVPVRFAKRKALPTLALTRVLPADADPWVLPEQAPQALRDGAPMAKASTTRIDVESRALTAFSGRPTALRGWVLTPPGYAKNPKRRYPTVYVTHGFGGTQDGLVGNVIGADMMMRSGKGPEMIYVFLDQSTATGTHEFADSVNNGPWGTALTTELIPSLEKQYRMDAKPSGRFLTGHSSGGWATLWLQVTYPKIFGGTWSTAPDSSDFRDFTGPDIYAPDANVYRKPDGTPWPLVRDKGEVKATFEQFAKLERVLGEYGGQMGSFDAVFSPRGADGRPLRMFDRDTGDVDPTVAAYWREHYDIAHRLHSDWPRLKRDLDGKLHVIVGDADTFYLDGAARRLKSVLDGLGAKSDVRFLPGKTHFDLYRDGDDRGALAVKIANEMFAVARPGDAKAASGASKATTRTKATR